MRARIICSLIGVAPSRRSCMRFSCVFAILVFLQSIIAGPRIRAADAADCTGVVLDENGAPVAASQVMLEDVAGRTYRAETDAAGRFALHNLSSGDYKAEVRKEGFFVL